MPIGETTCKCGETNEQGFRCWCECGNGVLRQGKYNRKGEKVVKYEKRFTKRARDSKLWEINREGLRLMGELIPYFDPSCWQGYKAGERKDDGRNE